MLGVAPGRRLAPAAALGRAVHDASFPRRRPWRELSRHRARLGSARILGRPDLERRVIRNAPHSGDRPGSEPQAADAGKQAAATLDPGKWIDESFELAKQYGYTKEVLKKVADREGHSHLGPLDLPANYKSDAEEVAERRAVEAGYRMAKAIEQMLQ